MKEILKALNQRPIAFYPIYADIMESVAGGVLLSQLLYWWGTMDGQSFYKTDEEIRMETRLNTGELKREKAKLKGLTFLTVERKGVPAKTVYTVDAAELGLALEKAWKTRETSQLVPTQYPNQFGRSVGTSSGTVSELSSETTQRLHSENEDNAREEVNSVVTTEEDYRVLDAILSDTNQPLEEPEPLTPAQRGVKILAGTLPDACGAYHPGFPCQHMRAGIEVAAAALWPGIPISVDAAMKEFRSKEHLHTVVHMHSQEDIAAAAAWWKANKPARDCNLPLFFSQVTSSLLNAKAAEEDVSQEEPPQDYWTNMTYEGNHKHCPLFIKQGTVRCWHAIVAKKEGRFHAQDVTVDDLTDESKARLAKEGIVL